MLANSMVSYLKEIGEEKSLAGIQSSDFQAIKRKISTKLRSDIAKRTVDSLNFWRVLNCAHHQASFFFDRPVGQ